MFHSISKIAAQPKGVGFYQIVTLFMTNNDNSGSSLSISFMVKIVFCYITISLNDVTTYLPSDIILYRWIEYDKTLTMTLLEEKC